MTDQERQIRRQSFIAGIRVLEHFEGMRVHALELLEAWAKSNYPDPPQPREIIVDTVTYRVVNGELEYQHLCGMWLKSATFSTESIRALNDLLENPNE